MWGYLNTIIFSEEPKDVMDEEVFSESEDNDSDHEPSASESEDNISDHEPSASENKEYPCKCVLTSEYPGNLTYFMAKMKSKCAKYDITMTPKYKKTTCKKRQYPL